MKSNIEQAMVELRQASDKLRSYWRLPPRADADVERLFIQGITPTMLCKHVPICSDGYRWESRADAQRALRAANAALADARSKVPLPDWAKQALAAGWKMPKGWKP